ncbi:MAG: hypothetical protein M1817_003858 [Caeruleum heppii]|nr:MAG: hypothetical protein M1817_003858 [Caeruleum heppii]
MSAAAKQAAGKVAQTAKQGHAGGRGALNKGARKDPELYILLAIMSGAFGLAGWHFGRRPTSSSSEESVGIAQNAMPWEDDKASNDPSGHYKYKYHPGGDPKKAPKEAPSALHSVIVPNVTLPKHLHDQYNKWGKDGY